MPTNPNSREVLKAVPAYGRDYKNQKAVQADWDANKDFRLNTGPYINKSDAVNNGITVIVAYKNNNAWYSCKN